jgi:hypothetical protein
MFDSVIDYGQYIFFSGNIILKIVLSGVISYLWGLLNDLSSITIISLININIPGLPRSIIRSVMSFAQMDILPSDLILNSIFKFDEIDDRPFNNQFALLGFESSNGAKNMGSAFLYLLFYSFLILLVSIFTFLKGFS